VAYVRVSTSEQDVENQVAYISRWAETRGFIILKLYVDEAISGASPVTERPGFRELINDIENNALNPKPAALLVYETSRLVRNFRELFRMLDIVENKLGLVIVSTSDREAILQNLDGAYRQFLRTMLAFVATMEREFIRQRTKAAMERISPRSRAEALPREVRERILDLASRGWSLRAIAKEVGLSMYLIRRILGPGDPGTCPRCLHKMVVVDKALVQLNGKYAIKQTLHCQNCGNDKEIINTTISSTQ